MISRYQSKYMENHHIICYNSHMPIIERRILYFENIYL